MKLMIDISKELKSAVYNCGLFLNPTEKTSLIDAINNGTPIPNNATNGDVFNAIYADISRTGTILMDDIENVIATNVNIGWWNAPYLKGGKE